jgi:HlyD family secretion protein
LTLLQEGFVKNSDISNMVRATTAGTVIDLPLKEGSSVIERNNFNDGTTIAVVARLDSFILRQGKRKRPSIS